MRFLGLISADGHSQKKTKNRWGRNISLWNNDEVVKRNFENLVKNLFSLKTNRIKHSKGRGEMVQFSSSLIARLLNKLGVPSGKKFDSFKLPPFLHKKEYLKSYLQALFDCEGSVCLRKNSIQFVIKNKYMINLLSLLLLKFGIFANVNKARKNIRLTINSKKNMRLFQKEIGFIHKNKKIKLHKLLLKNLPPNQSNIERIPFISKQVEKIRKLLGLKYKDFQKAGTVTSVKRHPTCTYDTLSKIYETLKDKSTKVNITSISDFQEIYSLLNSDIVWVPIKKIKKINPRSNYVYDLTMKKGNNFIANGVLVHNSASVLYGQLTTGKSVKIISKIDPKKKAHYYELHIDTTKNEPEIIKDEEINWEKDHGTKVEIELEAEYLKGKKSIDEYLKRTSIVNPHLRLIYITPEKEKIIYPRATQELPIEPREIKPHPHGIELGILIRMLKSTKARTLQGFLTTDFCRVGSGTAKKICEKADLYPNSRPKRIARQEADNLLKAIKETKLMSPPTDCLSPIGSDLLEKGLKKEIDAEFYFSTTRPVAVYRGFPFQVEAAVVYGGDLDKESPVRILRFANKVPLLYQQSACAITRAISTTNWRSYGLQQSGNNLPTGPALILVHIASVWVPFTSESKEAIAHYPEIIKEIKLALQECGRQLSRYVKRKIRKIDAEKKKGYIEKYLPHIGTALQDILNLKEKDEKKVIKILKDILERTRKVG